MRKSVAERAGCSKRALLFEENISLIQSGINETITKLSWNFSNKKKKLKKWNRQRKVSWRGDRTWVHGQNGLYDVRTDLKSREVLLPITRFKKTSTTTPKKVCLYSSSLHLVLFEQKICKSQRAIVQQEKQIHGVTGLVVWRKEGWWGALLQSFSPLSRSYHVSFSLSFPSSPAYCRFFL